MDKKIIKKYFSSPLLALAIACFLLAGISLLVMGKSIETQQQTAQISKKAPLTKIPTPTTSFKTVQHGENIVTENIKQPTNTPVPEIKNLSTNTPTPLPQATNQNLKVSLTISGSMVGTVELSQGANQCDVLSQALSQGKIQSLNMRYDSNLGTNGVYQINGVGKDNAVWWVYKVNGQSPNQGCSYIKVNNGDSAEWSYLGN